MKLDYDATQGMQDFRARLCSYSLLEALASRRSRRFARGMKLNGGPLAYASREAPEPLSQEEEAAQRARASRSENFTHSLATNRKC
jgi:hypothetical protein